MRISLASALAALFAASLASAWRQSQKEIETEGEKTEKKEKWDKSSLCRFTCTAFINVSAMWTKVQFLERVLKEIWDTSDGLLESNIGKTQVKIDSQFVIFIL